jgi:amidase
MTVSRKPRPPGYPIDKAHKYRGDYRRQRIVEADLSSLDDRVGAAVYLLAVEDLQAFSRTVAAFLTGVDLWLTPTMFEPPAPIGEITATPADPLRAIPRGACTAWPTGRRSRTSPGNPAMSVPLWHNAADLPIGVHVLGRYGAEATLLQLAGQLERARPWAHRQPPIHARCR